MDILSVEHVSKRFAEHMALDDVSLSIPRGSVYGLLGPNGAGKTTLIRIINRITAPDSGRVLFDGREIAPEDVCRIGYLPEERGHTPRFSPMGLGRGSRTAGVGSGKSKPRRRMTSQ